MIEPRLTIGIPHLDRPPEFLDRAIGSCLKQTIPVRVIVADQGHTRETADCLGRYREHPLVEHLLTDADCLWANWRAAAEACKTEFFLWLQDDDDITTICANRVVKAFNAFPAALHWQANCQCSSDGEHYVKWGWNGPQVPVRKNLVPEQWPGALIAPTCYIFSWALSPGVAFRCGPEFEAMLKWHPADCDLFEERLVVAYMGSRGPFAVDPVCAGYWNHHGGNESYRQNASGDTGRQMQVMFDHLDGLMDNLEDWPLFFGHWCRGRNPMEILSWLSNWPGKGSRHSDNLQAVMRDSLQGRVEALAPDPAETDQALVFFEEDSETSRIGHGNAA